MSLSKSISRQLDRIEAQIESKRPAETPLEAADRRFTESLINLLDAMPASYADQAVRELEAAAPENIARIRNCYEQWGAGLLPHLSSAVCRLACRLEWQVGLSFPIPCAMPAEICDFVQEHGDALFSKPAEIPIEGTTRTRTAPHYVWLTGGLICRTCFYPVPYKRPGVDRFNLTSMIDGPDQACLPFNKCPLCDGGLMFYLDS